MQPGELHSAAHRDALAHIVVTNLTNLSRLVLCPQLQTRQQLAVLAYCVVPFLTVGAVDTIEANKQDSRSGVLCGRCTNEQPCPSSRSTACLEGSGEGAQNKREREPNAYLQNLVQR